MRRLKDVVPGHPKDKKSAPAQLDCSPAFPPEVWSLIGKKEQWWKDHADSLFYPVCEEFVITVKEVKKNG